MSFFATEWQYRNYVGFFLAVWGVYCLWSILWPLEVFFQGLLNCLFYIFCSCLNMFWTHILTLTLQKKFWFWLFLVGFTSGKIERLSKVHFEWKRLKRSAITCNRKGEIENHEVSTRTCFLHWFSGAQNEIFTDLFVLALMRSHRRVETGDTVT